MSLPEAPSRDPASGGSASGGPADPDPARLTAILDFLAEAQQLKDTLRSGRTAAGIQESAAAHSWGVSLLAVLMQPDLGPLDMAKLLKLCVIHDLGEVISGDIPAPEQDPSFDKTAQERADFQTLTQALPQDLRAELSALWEEYAAGESREAQLAKGLDKIETMVQHISGAQAPGFDHLWNLGYARARTDADPVLQRIRVEVDRRTRAAAATP